MILSHMTYPQVGKLDRENVLVVVALGALEQHSHHMPCGTDHLLGDAMVERLEAALPKNILSLPTVWLGCSSHHFGFSGTLSVSTDTMSRVIFDLVGSVERSGFRKVLLLNSHGGNRAVIACAIQEMGTKYPDMTVVGCSYWDTARETLMEERDTPFGGMGHACELETSLMLHYRPELVDAPQAEADGIINLSRFSRGEMLIAPIVSVYKPVSVTSHHGGYGDPRSASDSKGQRFFDLIVDGLVELCHDILQDRI